MVVGIVGSGSINGCNWGGDRGSSEREMVITEGVMVAIKCGNPSKGRIRVGIIMIQTEIKEKGEKEKLELE
jgi:hypothetical protein